jgi:hypothetical protein
MNSLPVFLKVPMVAMSVLLDLKLRAAPLRPRWRSAGRRGSTAHPEGARQQRRNFLASRGMTAKPAGEESCDAAVAHRRSRLQPAFGQIRPLKRPLRCARSGGDLIGRTWRPLRPPKTPARRSERRLSTTDAGTAHPADRNTTARSVHPAALSDRRVRCPFASASRAGRSAPQKPGSRHHPIIVQHHEGTERHSFPGPAPASMAFRP